MLRNAVTKTSVAALIALVAVASVAAAVVLYPRLSGTGQGSAGIQMLSYTFEEDPVASNSQENEVFPFFIVQNIADKPITSLVGNIQGLPTLKFELFDSGRVYISQSNQFYPNEVGANLTLRPYQTNQFAIGDQYSITFTAMFSDGSTGQTTESFTVTNGSLGFCGAHVNIENDSFNSVTVSYQVDNSTGRASLVTSAASKTHLPLVAVLLGVNNGSEWLPFDYNGAAIGPSNTLPPGENLTQTFTWAYLAGTMNGYRVLFVGSCADENAMTSTSIHP